MLTPQEVEAARQKYGITPAGGASAVSSAPDRTSELSQAWAGAAAKDAGDESTKANIATFKATGKETPIVAAAKTAGNLPASTFNFGKSLVDFFNPLNTKNTADELGKSISDATDEGMSPLDIAAKTAKEIPGTAYKMLVPQFLQHIFSGDLEAAQATIENDPVGQIAPLLMLAKQGADAMGKGKEFDTAVSKIASPVTKAGKLVKKATGAAAAEIIGAGTGKGAESVKVAAEGTPAFKDALRGKTTAADVVRSAENVVSNVKSQRATEYQASLKQIGEDATSHDISSVHDELQTQLKNFGVKVKEDGTLDFKRSSIANNGTARSDIQGVYETLKDWGTEKGDRSGIGLDTLKRQLGDFYSESGQARALVQAVKGKLTDVLNTKVPGYQDMTSKYAQASDLLDSIKSATGAGKDANADTVFTKLTSAMKGDKDFRIAVLKQMEASGEPNLMDKIAGVNMKSWIPSGLIGRGIDVGGAYSILSGVLSPQYIPMLLATSPRIMGEFISAMGLGAKKTAQVLDAADKISTAMAKYAPGATAESNKKKKK